MFYAFLLTHIPSKTALHPLNGIIKMNITKANEVKTMKVTNRGFGRQRLRGIGGGSSQVFGKMNADFVSNLLDFLKIEKIKIKPSKVSDSEFWFDSSDGSIAVKVVIDNASREILYDVYSTEYNEHLKVEKMKDAEQLNFIAEEHRRWKVAEFVEEIWLILDGIKLWARKNKFNVKEKEMTGREKI